MPQVLSQDEVDALLSGIANEQVPADRSPASGSASLSQGAAVSIGGDLKPYDFTLSANSSRGRLPGLEAIFSNFARRLQNIFASELGKSVDASFGGMDVISYETLIQKFPLPASIHVVRLEPLRGLGALVIEARLAFAMIELFFGGNGHKVMKVEGRDFTPIETRFMGKFVERMLSGMEESWQSVAQLKSRYVRSELNPYLLNVAGMGDAMISATYTVNMAPISGTILFSIPLAAIEEFRGQLKSDVSLADEPEHSRLASRLRKPLLDVDLEVRAVVDVIGMKVREIMALRPGDVIQLNSAGLDQIELWVQDKRKFHGKGAQRNGNKVFVVSQAASPR